MKMTVNTANNLAAKAILRGVRSTGVRGMIRYRSYFGNKAPWARYPTLFLVLIAGKFSGVETGALWR